MTELPPLPQARRPRAALVENRRERRVGHAAYKMIWRKITAAVGPAPSPGV